MIQVQPVNVPRTAADAPSRAVGHASPASKAADWLPARLLVLACSATKRADPEPLPALARYDGPLWRTLRAADPDGRAAKVAFLSAHYGFRDAATPIADYDARLTQDLADRMIAGGVTTRWPRPPAPRRPDTYGMHPGAEIAGLTRHGAEPFVEIVLVGGRLYVAVMHALVRGFVEMGCVRRDARVSVINGPIGRMRQDLRAWLAAVPARGDRCDRAPRAHRMTLISCRCRARPAVDDPALSQQPR